MLIIEEIYESWYDGKVQLFVTGQFLLILG